jgi:putative DNA primase/helicase
MNKNQKIKALDSVLEAAELLPVLNEQYSESSENVNIEINKFDQEEHPSEHDEILKSMVKTIQPIDFYKRAQVGTSDDIERRHYLIISVEDILEYATEHKWGLCMNNQSVYLFNGSYWKAQPKDVTIKFLGDAALRLGVPQFEAKHFRFRDELYKQFFSTAFLPKPQKIGDEVLVNLQNGTFVITPETQYLKSFDRNDFVTYQLSFDYDPNATAPLFQQFLDRVLPDRDLQKVLAEFASYVFVKQKTLKLEKALILYGSGANGKSVFFEVINALLGPDNVSNYSLYSLTHENGYHRALIGDKLLNFASEISPKMDSTFFKQLVSGEPIEARLPYKEPFIISDYAKLIFNANLLPTDIENNEAFFRRFILIPFNVTIPEEERDPKLAKRIIDSELAGIFNWILDGLQRLLTNKGFTPSKVLDQTILEYRQQSDTVFLFLDEEGYVADIEEEVSLNEVYSNYIGYCKTGLYKAVSRRQFAERLRKLDFSMTRRSHGNVVGIKKKVS